MLLASNTQMRDAAERMALFDPLTNLPNRRMLADRLRESEVRAVVNNSRVGVIYLDLDGFKLVNDTLGHDAGDNLLRNAGFAMATMLRPDDCLARVGGDEFVVVIEEVNSRAELSALAMRLKTAVETAGGPGDGVKCTRVSCGVAVFPDDGQTAHDVMREADMAMYHAKRQRRGVTHLAGVA
jgi:diguanylate cyclase (GGDEF)-like protein